MAQATALEQDIGPSSPTYGGRSGMEIYDELIVGTSANTMSGNFFSDIWGNLGVDIDVQTLLHGHSLAGWNTAGENFAINRTAVSGAVSTIDENGNKTYTLTVARGLRYSDGSPITAADYVFSLLLEASPEVKELGGSSNMMKYILGAKAYTDGQEAVLKGVRLLNEQDLAITIAAEHLPFFYELGLLGAKPFPMQVIAPGCEVADDGEGAYIRNAGDAQGVQEPIFTTELLQKTLLDDAEGYITYPKVSSGAYKLISYDAENYVVSMEVNPYYGGDDDGKLPMIERIIFKYVPEELAISQLADGEVDLLNKVMTGSVIDAGRALSTNENFVSTQYPRTGFGFISYTCEQGPAQFVSVRQAIAMCLDRDAFIQEQLGNYGVKVKGYYGIGQWMARIDSGRLARSLGDAPEDATPEEVIQFAADVEKMAALSLGNVAEYEFDLAAAEKLLIADGWVLNQEGNEYNGATDGIRAKMVDGELKTLEMELLLAEENDVQDMFLGMQENMRQIGADLTIKAISYNEMMAKYYRREARDNDMFYLGSNFMAIFDPTSTYSIYDEDQGELNTTGLRDEKLMKLAANLIKTEPGDIAEYVSKWVTFQEYWSEVLPMVPIYSNVYFDFHTDRLHNYRVPQRVTWGNAVILSYLSEPADRAIPVEEPVAE